MTVVRADPEVTNAQFDWDEPTKVIRLVVDQNKARVLGFSSQDLAAFLNNSVSGLSVTYVRERDKQIEVLLRGAAAERARLSFLKDLAIPTRNGKAVPITQIADIRYEQEDGHRLAPRPAADGHRALRRAGATRRGPMSRPGSTRGSTRSARGCRSAIGSRSAARSRIRRAGQKSIAAGVPLMMLAVLTLLMIQLQSFSRTLMVLLTAPLGLIGVTVGAAGVRTSRSASSRCSERSRCPESSCAIRSSSSTRSSRTSRPAHAPWDAIVGATMRRFRPIVLTAAAAVLGMIPLVRSAFFGPMAVAMMGGILVATVLTLGFLPALYAAWFRVRPAAAPADGAAD